MRCGSHNGNAEEPINLSRGDNKLSWFAMGICNFKLINEDRICIHVCNHSFTVCKSDYFIVKCDFARMLCKARCNGLSLLLSQKTK